MPVLVGCPAPPPAVPAAFDGGCVVRRMIGFPRRYPGIALLVSLSLSVTLAYLA